LEELLEIFIQLRWSSAIVLHEVGGVGFVAKSDSERLPLLFRHLCQAFTVAKAEVFIQRGPKPG
jgi:hypothetical protein